MYGNNTNSKDRDILIHLQFRISVSFCIYSMRGLEKERYELLERGTAYDWGGTSPQKRVMEDVVGCENTILALCVGRFPK